jgi:hypothetical protein
VYGYFFFKAVNSAQCLPGFTRDCLLSKTVKDVSLQFDGHSQSFEDHSEKTMSKQDPEFSELDDGFSSQKAVLSKLALGIFQGVQLRF